MKKTPVVVAVSGYFNPLHTGHLDLIVKAKQFGDKLIVIVNNDHQVKLKGSYPFMKETDRMAIMKSLQNVDDVFLSIDEDLTVCKSLITLKPHIFANGGDRDDTNIPEYDTCKKHGIEIVYGLGNKIDSSSSIISRVMEERMKFREAL